MTNLTLLLIISVSKSRYIDSVEMLSLLSFREFYTSYYEKNILKEDKRMITFTILTLILALLIAFLILVVAIGGASLLMVFGDVIVCAVLIVFIIKKIFFKKKH